MRVPIPSLILRLLASLLVVLQGVLLVLWIFHHQMELPGILQWSGRTHPLLVHFPIAMLLMLTLAWLFRRWVGEMLFRDRTFKNLLLLSAFIATLTALSGYFLSGQSDYDETLLDRHRNLGSLTAVLSALLWIAWPWSPSQDHDTPARITRAGSLLFSLLSLSAIIVLVLAGHYGGSLTHGEGYLLPGTEETSAAKRVITDSSTLYAAAVLPVLEGKCISCHNNKKSKGGLNMASLAGIQQGGKNGALWVAGDPMRSLMVKRILLDLSDKKHMPPRGKPQLTDEEIGLISYWIQRGADLHQQLREIPADDSLRLVAGSIFQTQTAVEAKAYDFPAADPAQLSKLQHPYRHIVPVHQGSPALELSFFLRQQFSLSMLEACAPLAPQIVAVNLAHMPVGDEVIPVLAKFPQLETLNLSGTKVTGENLDLLSGLRHMETLVLSGTAITQQSLQALQQLPSLRRVYLAQTGIDSTALAKLQGMMPRIGWIGGNPASGKERLRLTPPQLVDPDKRIFADNESVSLRHPMKAVTIRYTVDGLAPDSVRSPGYESPIPVPRPMTIRAIAVMEGWLASEEVRYQVFPKGWAPLRSRLGSFPDTRYALQGAPSLFDNQTGDPGNLLVNWMGFREQPMNLLVTLDGDRNIRQVTISTAINHGAYVFPPLEIRVRAGMDSGRWTYTTSLRPDQPKGYGPLEHKPFIISLKPGRWKYLEIIVQPIPALPSWHGGKGQKGWAFIDEIFID